MIAMSKIIQLQAHLCTVFDAKMLSQAWPGSIVHWHTMRSVWFIQPGECTPGRHCLHTYTHIYTYYIYILYILYICAVKKRNCTCMNMYIYICTQICACLNIQNCTQVRMHHILYINAYVYVYAYVNTRIYIYIYVYVYTCIYLYIYLSLSIYLSTYLSFYLYIYLSI